MPHRQKLLETMQLAYEMLRDYSRPQIDVALEIDNLDCRGNQYLYVVNVSKGGQVVYWRNFTTLLGHDEDFEPNLQYLINYMHPDDITPVTNLSATVLEVALEHILAGNLDELLEHTYSIDYRVMRADGEYMRVLRHSFMLYAGDRQTIYQISVCTDISAHKSSDDIGWSIVGPASDRFVDKVKEKLRETRRPTFF